MPCREIFINLIDVVGVAQESYDLVDNNGYYVFQNVDYATLINGITFSIDNTSYNFTLTNYPQSATWSLCNPDPNYIPVFYNSGLYLINLFGGGSTGSSNTTYNNYYVGSGITVSNTLSNILTTTGQVSAISMSFSNLTSAGYFNNGGSYVSELHPADVTRTGVYTTNISLAVSGSDLFINGLTDSFYEFEMFGSRASSAESTRFRFIGSTTSDTSNLLVGNNATYSVSVIMKPNGSDDLEIRFRGVSTFGHFNALKIIQLTPISFGSLVNFQNSPTNYWRPITTGSNGSGKSSQYLPADGYIQSDITDNAGTMNNYNIGMGFATSSNLTPDYAYNYLLYVEGANDHYKTFDTPSGYIDTGITASSGDKIRLRRDNDTVYGEYFRNSKWNNAYTFPNTSTASLYIYAGSSDVGSIQYLVHPNGFGIV